MTFMVRSLSSRRLDVVVVALLITAALLIYRNALNMGYMADDFDWLRLALATDFVPFDRITTIGTGSYFRPLVSLSLRLEHNIVTFQASLLHHLMNLLFHLGSAVLVYFSAKNISRDWTLSAALALFFLLHPLAVTPVYWLANRVDSLVTFFYLLGVFSFLQLLAGSVRRLALFGSLVGLVCALLTKEMAVTFPVVLLLVWWLYRQHHSESRGQTRWLTGAWFAATSMTLVYLVFLWFGIYREVGGQLPPLSLHRVAEALVNALVQLVVPNRNDLLVSFYYAQPWLLMLALGLLLAAAGVLAAVLWRRSSSTTGRLWPFALASLFLITLVPLFLVGANSRRMHLPLAVLCLALAFLPTRLPHRRRPLTLVLILLLLPLAVVSYHDGAVWLDNWQLTQRYCESFQQHLAEDREGAYLLLGVPGHARNTHIFSNDANAALYHCINGEFAAFSRFLALGELRTQQAVPPGVRVVMPQQGHYVLTPLHADDFFVLWPGAQENERYGDRQLSVYVDVIDGPGRVKQITVVANQLALQDIVVLSFEKTRFYELSGVEAE